MRKKFVITGALVALLGIGAASPAMAADNLQLIINNELYTQTEQQAGPQMKNERVHVPLRLISETLGHQVNWIESQRIVSITTDSQIQTAILDDGTVVPEDAPIRIYIDGEELTADESTGMPYIAETGQSMVPLRLVGEALNCSVNWVETANSGIVIVEEIPEEPVVEVLKPADTANEDEQDVVYEPVGYHRLTIQGDSIATAAELNAFLDAKEDGIRKMMETRYPELGFTPFPEDIAELYLEIGAKYNIRGDLAFAQALKETGYFQFYGSVQSFQNNFCGLGASGIENTGEEALNGVDPGRAMYIPGLHGLTFMTVEDGVEAHIQHLYAYTTKKDIPAGCELVDPRFNYVKRGVAQRWIDLNGRWAVPGNGYGESIIDDYWMPAVEDELPPWQE